MFYRMQTGIIILHLDFFHTVAHFLLYVLSIAIFNKKYIYLNIPWYKWHNIYHYVLQSCLFKRAKQHEPKRKCSGLSVIKYGSSPT